MIRLVLGRDDAGEGGTVDKYRQAASELETWRARGALVPTERPSFTLYEMRFSLQPAPRDRGAPSARLVLEDPSVVVPHEQTMPGRSGPPPVDARGPDEPVEHPRGVPGSERTVRAFLDDAMARGPAGSTTDEAGVEHTLWVSEPNPEVATWLTPESLMIADGHHRYSMALRYRDEMRAEHGPGVGSRDDVHRGRALQEPVLPFHRIQTGGPHEPTGTRVRDLAEVLETVSDEKLVYGSASLEDGLLVHRVGELAGTPPVVCALHERVLSTSTRSFDSRPTRWRPRTPYATGKPSRRSSCRRPTPRGSAT